MIKKLNKKTFQEAIKILDSELGKKRVRSSKFLYQKFKKYPEFFMGLFLDRELIGVITGFPREDYLLISELAIDSKFHKRGFGKKLVLEFEKEAKKKNYKKINVGAKDNEIKFYLALNYSPFLLIQFKEKTYKIKDFPYLDFQSIKQYDNIIALEIKIKEIDEIKLKRLRKKFPQANFQYIFTKIV